MILKYWTDDDPIKRDFPVPTDLSWGLNDLDKDSGRNAEGYMLREVVGKKHKIVLKWKFIEETDEFRQFVKWGKTLPPFLYVQFNDPSGDLVEMECYSPKLSASLAYDDKSVTLWKDFSMSFTGR